MSPPSSVGGKLILLIPRQQKARNKIKNWWDYLVDLFSSCFVQHFIITTIFKLTPVYYLSNRFDELF